MKDEGEGQEGLEVGKASEKVGLADCLFLQNTAEEQRGWRTLFLSFALGCFIRCAVSQSVPRQV